MNSPRFLTLTAPPVALPLKQHLAALLAALKRLRRMRSWKQRVVGGGYTLEITRGQRGERWHPHIHIIIDGDYYPHDEIRDAWRQALNYDESTWNIAEGDPLIVDVRKVNDARKAAKYLAKYATKPADLAGWSRANIIEYALAVAGVRLLQTFGTLHGVKLDEEAVDEAGVGDIEHFAHVEDLLDLSKRGDPQSRWILMCAASLWPILMDALPPPDRPEPARTPEEVARAQIELRTAIREAMPEQPVQTSVPVMDHVPNVPKALGQALFG